MKGYLIAAWIAIAALGWTVLLLWRENERQDREIRAALGSAESANYGVQSQVANALREQKRQSDFASARYFPERAFDDDLVRDTILADIPQTPFWKVARARLRPVVDLVALPLSLLDAFLRTKDPYRDWGQLLRFLSPLTIPGGPVIEIL
jgi:hypothetical protein